jgi:hypothetical protein
MVHTTENLVPEPALLNENAFDLSIDFHHTFSVRQAERALLVHTESSRGWLESRAKLFKIVLVFVWAVHIYFHINFLMLVGF